MPPKKKVTPKKKAAPKAKAKAAPKAKAKAAPKKKAPPKKKFDDATRTKMSKARMLKALSALSGNVTLCVKKASISRALHYQWLENDPDYKQAVADVAEANVDMAESKLIINVKRGEQRAVEYLLDHKGKHRGYGKQLAITGPNDGPIKIEQEIDEDNLKKELEALGYAPRKRQLETKEK